MPEATKEEVESILRTLKPFRTPGIDDISNEFLQSMGPKLAKAPAILATSCWTLGHYTHQLKKARTVTLRKPGKALYSDPGAWRPIALLNTIRKIIETLMAFRTKSAYVVDFMGFMEHVTVLFSMPWQNRRG